MKTVGNGGLAPAYQDAVDKAVEAAATGVTDYNGAIRETLRQTAGTGLTVDGSEKVTYASGHRRRLDSAVRMNVIDAVRQVQQQSAAAVGRETGCDAVELSAHPFAAQDHEPVQGRVFKNEEFERMQLGLDVVDADGRHHDGFPRPVGIWNCRHFAAPFQLGVSKRRYTDEQLDQWREANQKGCELWGRWLNPETGKYEEGYKHFTTYGAGQYMRQLETAMRKQRDIENAAKVSGDAVLRRDAQQKRRTLSERYKYVAETSGLKARFERTRAEAQKPVANSVDSGIIKTGGGEVTIRSIDSPIEQRNSSRGKPSAITHFDVELNSRQQELLEKLPEYNSRSLLPKDDVGMPDLAALTAKTGDEFSLFTKGSERLVVRGNGYKVEITIDDARELADAGYVWSGHTHPGADHNCLIASKGDVEILQCFNQLRSCIYNSLGEYLEFWKE